MEREETGKSIIVMGVTGSGKSTVGQRLAESLGWEFADADDFHPESNREKMSRGVPLSEEDRLPWLQSIHKRLSHDVREGSSLVVACSALREQYRKILKGELSDDSLLFVYLRGSRQLIRRRLRERRGHFAGEEILDDQFRVLEEPQDSLTIDVEASPGDVVEAILRDMQERGYISGADRASNAS